MDIQIVENDLMKLSSECGILKKQKTIIYFRNIIQKFRKECIQCTNIKNKEWAFKNQDKTENNKIGIKKRRCSDFIFLLAHNIRSRTTQTSKSENAKKLNKAFDLLGFTNSFFQRRFSHQLYGKMTL